AAASQGNLPEVMATYTSFLERYTEDWRRNAQSLYGCDGVVTDLCQGWRHGAVLMSTYPWTGGAGWLSNYMYDHYLVTQDRDYLQQHVVPLLKEVVAFYEDFLLKYPSHNGRAVFYPSISPENTPVMTPADQSTNVVPNATGEISICREAVTHLIEACNHLNIEQDNVPRWQALLSRLPDYVINDDGALAEWAYPGLGDKYNHRHSSHLYAIYPSLEISPDRTPNLFRAARIAMEKRMEAGLGGDSAHGLMHISLIAARLKNSDLLWQMLTDFASLPFMNTSFVTCHNPGPRIYNLDATFSMPAVMMEMLLYSEPGLVELLPALPIKQFSRGTLCGPLARGGIVVEQLHWNKTLNRVDVTLRSTQAQTIHLRFGIDLRFVNAAEPQDRSRVSSAKQRGTWHIDLPANRSIRLECRM
ncbi:MAG: glycoside hydrolase family 95 protein, partial [Planctomycetes bacterium]|nr:glycoside hydrolase family 95 protein [Planctomycetota bacterium]